MGGQHPLPAAEVQLVEPRLVNVNDMEALVHELEHLLGVVLPNDE